MKTDMAEKHTPMNPEQKKIFMGMWDAKVTSSGNKAPLPLKDSVMPLSDLLSKDSLTGALNRRKFDADLPNFVKKNEAAILIFDGNNMKAVNDRFGHAAGDHLLRRIAALLEGSVSADDSIYRIGGDEFALLLEHIPRENLDVVINRIKKEFTSEPNLSKPSVSGGAVYLDKKTDPSVRENAFICADAALQRAKVSLKATRGVLSEKTASEIFSYESQLDGSPDTLRQLALKAKNHGAGG